MVTVALFLVALEHMSLYVVGVTNDIERVGRCRSGSGAGASTAVKVAARSAKGSAPGVSSSVGGTSNSGGRIGSARGAGCWGTHPHGYGSVMGERLFQARHVLIPLS